MACETPATLSMAEAVARLAAAGIAAPQREARLLLAHELGCAPESLIGQRMPPPPGFAALIARRASREPLAFILGRREFWSLPFAVSPVTLIPRPESEALLEAALAALPHRAAVRRVLDLGTGTGCLLLAALTEFPAAFGVGVDLVPEAALLARTNAESLGLAARAAFLVGNWAAALVSCPRSSSPCATNGADQQATENKEQVFRSHPYSGAPDFGSGTRAGTFDLIFANPPYIERAAIPGLMPEVARFEPLSALDGGPDGLDAYRQLLPSLPHLLTHEGLAILELGFGGGDRVVRLAEAEGLAIRALEPDLQGNPRALVLASPG
ncbi:MAG TPA: peptide chain release factor N(5)-glutamine methyltransferase [Acetobacteraceae bacterium]|nr:peptide chain release factor N(5)-glutamine methyltransferase [Acetobacteraceae bacterium]